MLQHLKAFAAAASLLAIVTASPAFAENRFALVIGNSAYRAVPALPNAQNDASKMSELLAAAGFEVMTSPDQSQNQLRQTIGEFAAKLTDKGPDTVALVFYAGHGIQVDGENYLVPIDVDPKREADVPLQAVRLNDLLNALNSVPNKMRIVMLDACRNNPFPAISQTTGRGLAMVDTKSGAPGTFISYSTSPGSEAEDGSGTNSPYTTALLSVAREPGLPIEEAFKRVRVSVNNATQGRQVPWESSSLTSDFRFFTSPGSASPPSTAPGAAAKPSLPRKTTDDWRRELQGKQPQAAYDLVIAEDTVEAYEVFVALFGQSQFAVRTRTLLERRKEMIAWNVAVLLNSAASYRSFVVSYPGSDLSATARRLEDRMRNRPLNASAAILPNAGPGGGSAPPSGSNTTPTTVQPANVSLAPATCPCNVAPQPPKKRAEPKQPPKRAAVPPPRGRPPIDDDDIVYVRPQPRVYVAPPPRVYIGPGPYIGGGYSRPPGGYGPRPGPPVMNDPQPRGPNYLR